MDPVDWIKYLASATTIIAATLVAANYSAKLMVTGFVIFVVASISWIAAGWLQDEPSLYIQNIVLLFVNAAGIYRWLPRAANGE